MESRTETVENSLQGTEEVEIMKKAYEESHSLGYALLEFLDGLTDNNNSFTPDISTGFENLDEILGGGLRPGLYVIGSITSMGRTTFINQMGDQIAANGQDVLMFSLVEHRKDLIAKSISRQTALDALQNHGDMRNAKSAADIMDKSRYSSYSGEEQDTIRRAIAALEKFDGHIYVIEKNVSTDQIRDTIDRHLRLTGHKPVVFIDELLMLSYPEVNTDRAVWELKRMSQDFELPVILLSPIHLASHRDPVTVEAFDEYAAILHACDVLIGLQYKRIGKKDFDLFEEMQRNPREVEFEVLMNRKGQQGGKAEFDYYPAVNYFKEVR